MVLTLFWEVHGISEANYSMEYSGNFGCKLKSETVQKLSVRNFRKVVLFSEISGKCCFSHLCKILGDQTKPFSVEWKGPLSVELFLVLSQVDISSSAHICARNSCVIAWPVSSIQAN